MINYTSIKNIPKWPYLILLVLGFAYYGNSLKNGFSMDDDLVTCTPEYHHKNVSKGFSGIVPIFKSRYTSNASQSYEYRPITTVSFAIQYAFFGDVDNEEHARLNPNNEESIAYWQKQASVSHFISVFLYCLCCILVFILVFKVVSNHKLEIALTTAILFLIHPIHTEVVDNIKCRDELLVMFFGFCSILLLYKYVQDQSQTIKSKLIWLILGLTCIVLAVFSKKSALMFVGLIPLCLWFFTTMKKKQLYLLTGMVIISSLIFFFTQKLMFSEPEIREVFYFENPLYFHKGIMFKLPMFFYSIMWYLKMMLLPYPMGFYYGYNQIPLANFSMIIVWIGAFLVVGLTVLSMIRINKKEMWSFGFLFFMLSIGGVANLVLIPPGIVADRFLLIPSFGLLIIIAHYGVFYYQKLKQNTSFKYGFYGLVGAIFVLTLVQTTNRNNDWKSKYSLYYNDCKHLTASTKAYSLLAVEYKRKADINKNNLKIHFAYIDSSEKCFDKAIEIYPEYASCLNNLAILKHINRQQTNKAIPLFKKATLYKKNYHQAYHSLGTCYEKNMATVDFLMNSLQFVKPDSSSSVDNENNLPNAAIFNSASFGATILDFINKTINSKGNGIFNPEVQKTTMKEIVYNCEQYAYLENSFLKNNFNFKNELFNPIQQAFSVLSPENYQETINMIEKGVQYKFGVFYANLITQDIKIKNFEDADIIYQNLNDKRVTFYDSASFYYQSAMDAEKKMNAYYNYYLAMLSKEKNEKKYVEINQYALDQEELEIKTQYYINLGNYYIYTKEYDLAIDYINKGIVHVEELIIKSKSNQELTDKQKNQELKYHYDMLKTLYQLGVQVYTNNGDVNSMNKFQNKINGIN